MKLLVAAFFALSIVSTAWGSEFEAQVDRRDGIRERMGVGFRESSRVASNDRPTELAGLRFENRGSRNVHGAPNQNSESHLQMEREDAAPTSVEANKISPAHSILNTMRQVVLATDPDEARAEHSANGSVIEGDVESGPLDPSADLESELSIEDTEISQADRGRDQNEEVDHLQAEQAAPTEIASSENSRSALSAAQAAAISRAVSEWRGNRSPAVLDMNPEEVTE